MRYFRKSLPQTPLILSTGRKLIVPVSPDGNGYISTDDAALMKELDLAIVKRVGGITELTADEYDDAQKKISQPKESNASSRPLYRANQWPLHIRKKADAVAKKAESQSEPIPKPEIMISKDDQIKIGVALPVLKGSWKPVNLASLKDLGIETPSNR